MKVLLVVSILFNIWFASSVADLQAFKYSLIVGLCGDEPEILERIEWIGCLDSSKPSTHPMYDLLRGIGVL